MSLPLSSVVPFFTIMAAALAGVGLTSAYKDAKCTAKFKAYEVQLSVLRTENLLSILQKERTQRSVVNNLEVQYNAKIEEVQSLRLELERLARSSDGVRREPGTSDSPGLGVPSPDPSGGALRPSPGNGLSEEGKRLLVEISERGERAGAYARLCYEYVKSLEENSK